MSDQAPPEQDDAARPAWWATSAVPYRWFWLLASAGVPIGLAGASVFSLAVWLSFICAELPALALEASWRRKLGPKYDAPGLTIGLEPLSAGSEPTVRLARSGPRDVWRAYKRLTQLSWPRRFPIVQFPNAPLTIAFLAGAVSSRTHGSGSAYAHAISYLAMGVWAYEELADGINWFRHLLGLAYTISTVVHLAVALQR